MKRYLLLIGLFSLVFTSCSTDSSDKREDDKMDNRNNSSNPIYFVSI